MRWRQPERPLPRGLPGRGRAAGARERLRDPSHYVVPQYVADMVTLIARVTASDDGRRRALVRHLDGRPDRHDPGFASKTARSAAWSERHRPDPRPGGAGAHRRLHRPGPALPDFEAGARFVRSVSSLVRPAQRRRVGQAGRDVLVQETAATGCATTTWAWRALHAAITPERAEQDQAALWAAFDAIRCPTLLVRGELSDLLSRATAEK
jgi:hypothetical protein